MGNREKSKWLGLELNQGQFVNKKVWVVGLSIELLRQSSSMTTNSTHGCISYLVLYRVGFASVTINT